ncbi:carboxypeptidase-like regulatory domain-containing protein [Spirosoma luteolum]
MPCLAPWQTMTPAPDGRFCSQCQTTVVDFTTMTDAEVVAYLNQSPPPNPCGRFRADQLNRPLARPAHRPARLWLGWLVSGWLGTQAAAAQTPTPRPVPASQTAPIKPRAYAPVPSAGSPALHTIRGQLVQLGGQPVAYGAVVVEATGRGTNPDSSGHFELTIPDSLVYSTPTLLISAVGFKTRRYRLLASQVGPFIRIYLEEDTEVLNKVIVAGLYAPLPPTRWQRIRNWFRHRAR